MATRIQAAVMKTKSGMTTQVRGLPCLSKSGHGKPRLSYNGHIPEPLSHHVRKALPDASHLVLSPDVRLRSGNGRTAVCQPSSRAISQRTFIQIAKRFASD